MDQIFAKHADIGQLHLETRCVDNRWECFVFDSSKNAKIATGKSVSSEGATLFHDLRRSAARNLRRAGVPEHTIMKIAGWKTPWMFRRYDIQDGRDLQKAGETMEKWIASRDAISTVTSTIEKKAQSSDAAEIDANRLN